MHRKERVAQCVLHQLDVAGLECLLHHELGVQADGLHRPARVHSYDNDTFTLAICFFKKNRTRAHRSASNWSSVSLGTSGSCCSK